MKNIEIKKLNAELIFLINHCIETKNKNWNLNYALNQNGKRLKKAIEAIDAQIPDELKTIEEKVWKAATEIAKEKEVEATFELGLPSLTDEEAEQRAFMMKEWNDILQEETDINLYYIDVNKCQDANLDFEYVTILSNFIKE